LEEKAKEDKIRRDEREGGGEKIRGSGKGENQD
jgi:hypothetical protein